MKINPQRSLLPIRIPIFIAAICCLFLGGCGRQSFPVGTWKHEDHGPMADGVQLYTLSPDHKGKLLFTVNSSILGNQSSEAAFEWTYSVDTLTVASTEPIQISGQFTQFHDVYVLVGKTATAITWRDQTGQLVEWTKLEVQ